MNILRLLIIFSSLLGVALADLSSTGVSPDEALKSLRVGNARFQAGKPIYRKDLTDKRGKLAKGQAPFAAILGRSDSRVSPEIVFDQSLGDLFVVRVAGNVSEGP